MRLDVNLNVIWYYTAFGVTNNLFQFNELSVDYVNNQYVYGCVEFYCPSNGAWPYFGVTTFNVTNGNTNAAKYTNLYANNDGTMNHAGICFAWDNSGVFLTFSLYEEAWSLYESWVYKFNPAGTVILSQEFYPLS